MHFFADRNRIERNKQITTHSVILLRLTYSKFPSVLVPPRPKLTDDKISGINIKIKPWGQLFRLVSPPGLSNLSECYQALWPRPLPLSKTNVTHWDIHSHTRTHTLMWQSVIIIIFLFKCMACYFAEGPCVKWGFRVDRCVDILFFLSLEIPHRSQWRQSRRLFRGNSTHIECTKSLSISLPEKLQEQPLRVFI